MTATTSTRTQGHSAVVTGDDIVVRPGARRALALARLSTGFIFLWAFLDKTFGLGYSTPSDRAWINGGPFKDFFASIASPATDVLFMLGMLAVGVAVMAGMGVRVAAVAGSLIMFLMWVAEWPMEAGTNPFMDYHIIYALVLVVVAYTLAGDTWGLGKWWANLPIVKNNGWLR
jgi:thiosulfate dehydrogenase [quinone] large subunit